MIGGQVENLLAHIAPQAQIIEVHMADPAQVIVESLGGSLRTLYLARDTLRRYREDGLTPEVRAALKEDPGTRWVMEEAEREAPPGPLIQLATIQRSPRAGVAGWV